MENQLENLKLNAKNIKSSLVFSNKELSKSVDVKPELVIAVKLSNNIISNLFTNNNSKD
mgnify:CR=1 FL=1